MTAQGGVDDADQAEAIVRDGLAPFVVSISRYPNFETKVPHFYVIHRRPYESEGDAQMAADIAGLELADVLARGEVVLDGPYPMKRFDEIVTPFLERHGRDVWASVDMDYFSLTAAQISGSGTRRRVEVGHVPAAALRAVAQDEMVAPMKRLGVNVERVVFADSPSYLAPEADAAYLDRVAAEVEAQFRAAFSPSPRPVVALDSALFAREAASLSAARLAEAASKSPRSETAAAWIAEWNALKASTKANRSWDSGNPLYVKFAERWGRRTDAASVPALVEFFLYLLMDEDFQVRRAAVEIIVGMLVSAPLPVDTDLLLAHLENPRISAERYGEPYLDTSGGQVYDRGRGIRNKRLAILSIFVLGATKPGKLGMKAIHDGELARVIRRELDRGVKDFGNDAAANVAAYRARLLSAGDAVLAGPAPMSFFDVLVLEGLRGEVKIVQLRGEDPYQWLHTGIVELIALHPGTLGVFTALSDPKLAADYDRAYPVQPKPASKYAFLAPPKISFLAKVWRATGREGGIVIGDEEFMIRQEEPGDLLTIYSGGRVLTRLLPDQVREFAEPPAQGTAQITVQLQIFKQMLEKAIGAARDIKLDTSLDKRPVTLEVDLDAFDPGQGFREAILPLLVEELRHARRYPYGEKSAILLRSADPVTAQDAATELNLYGLIAFTREDQLPTGFKDKKTRILLTTPESAGQDSSVRRLYLRAPAKGDIPNFRAGIRAALGLARLESLDVPSLVSSRIDQLLRAFVPDIDLALFVRVSAAGSTDTALAGRVALPPIVRLPVEAWIRGARLAVRLIQQSA